MRFNPKARLDNSRVSDAGRGGGGGGLGGGSGMKLPIPTGAGGGKLGLVIVVVFFLIAMCTGNVPGINQADDDNTTANDPGGSGLYDGCTSGEDANNSASCARVAVENSLSDYWGSTLPNLASVKFTPARIKTFTAGTSTGCGSATSQVGPFYCPADSIIYLDPTFFRDVLEGQLGGKGGDFVEPYVIGHEYGHHIQNLLGTMGKVRTQQGAESDAVRLELQADCYAGMWTRAATSTTDSQGQALLEGLDQGDINEALDSAKTVGDDRIQQKTSGRINPDGWTHGSSEQRMRWFTIGYEKGSLQACDTFSARDLG